MIVRILLISFFVAVHNLCAFATHSEPADSSMVRVKKTTDFEVSGDGRAANWAAAEWINMKVQEPETETRVTKAKILYSDLGMYFLFDCQDQKVTSTIREDFGALFKEDAVEVFLWPDQSVPVYIEYELSPLDYELILLVPNIGGRFQGWTPLAL